MTRLGWIVFKDGTNMEEAFKSLDNAQSGDFVLHIAINHNFIIRTRTLIGEFSEPERLEQDLKQIQELAQVLDKEAGFAQDSGFAKIQEYGQQLTLSFEDSVLV
jgi:hypothetical protein